MSTVTSATNLFDTLRKTRLYTDAALAELMHGYHAEGYAADDATAAARWLVQRGCVTSFQAQKLLTGKYKNFLINRKYVVLEPLGSGGMGAVFRCRHLLLNKDVALKVLPSRLTADPGSLQRFLREARALAALDHPNIVQAHDCDEAQGRYFLVMGCVEGINLQQLVEQHGPLTVPQAAYYVSQACLGMQHAFEAGWIHRDLKPGNLLVDRQDTIKLLDLGLARMMTDPSGPISGVQDEESMIGSPDYISPEQSLNSPEIDIRSDIYSLGATLHFLLAGKPPFEGLPLMQKLLAHQMKTPPDLQHLRGDVPLDLAAIVRRMMAKVPSARYATPGVVAAALRPWACGYRPNPGAVPVIPQEHPEYLYDAAAAARRPGSSGSAHLLSDPLLSRNSTHPHETSLSDPLFPSAPLVSPFAALRNDPEQAGAIHFPAGDAPGPFPEDYTEDDAPEMSPAENSNAGSSTAGILVAGSFLAALVVLVIAVVSIWWFTRKNEEAKPVLPPEQQAILRADELCRKEQWRDAAEVYKQLLLSVNNDPKKRRDVFNRLLVKEREPILPHLAACMPNDVQVQDAAGLYHYNRKEFTQSHALYTALTGPNKGEHVHWQTRAMCEAHLGRWEDATRSMDRGMAVNPDCMRCRTSLAFLFAYFQQRENYQRQCDELLRRLDKVADPTTAALVGLAFTVGDQPREVLLKVREVVDRQAEKEPQSSQMKLAQGLLCHRLGDHAAGMEVLLEAEKHQENWSGSPAIKPVRVLILHRLGRWGEAQRAMRELIAWQDRAKRGITPDNQCYLPGCWDTLLMEILCREAAQRNRAS